MPFIKELVKYKSCSIVGLEKNTGKTVCLNYVLDRLPLDGMRIAVSSIGIDGETTDQVTRTAKPEIILKANTFFATSEKHYLNRKLVSELVDVSDESTSLGRIVTAKALTKGKILLSGPSSNFGLRRWMTSMRKFDIDLILIDGALSRMSLASPATSESMILSTGAAYSANINTLVQKTAFVVEMINLDLTSEENRLRFNDIHSGVWAVDDNDELHDLKVTSSLSTNLCTEGIEHCRTLYLTGALTDTFLNHIRGKRLFKETEVVVTDFTKIFLTPLLYKGFVSGGGKISVMMKSKLIAVTVNPTAPNGMVLDSEKLCKTLSEAINLPVYDLMKN
ncbi:MAG: hypothetical protein MJZ47_04930 [Bacteroidales bacterium]|nr:hypothetical protein [Bacteroidales bacterium]